MSICGQFDLNRVAGLLLTGGSSRRMGRPKAALPSRHHGECRSLAQRTAAILVGVTGPVLEVGPGYSGLPHVSEDPPGGGPLMAVAAGARELLSIGSTGPAVVLATDMPLLEAGLVEWLAAHPAPRSVIPVVGGVAQPLCARYDRNALDAAVAITERGGRAMKDLLSAVDHTLAGPEEWAGHGIDASWFTDADTPGDLEACAGEERDRA